MANRSIISKIVSYFRKPVGIAKRNERFIGQDNLGNRYFEKLGDGKGRKQRRVQPLDNDISIVPEVPVEWMTWLQHRRIDPPSEEEIEKNLHNMLRTQARAREREHIKKEMNTQEGAALPERHAASNFPQYEDMETYPGELTDTKNKNR